MSTKNAQSLAPHASAPAPPRPSAPSFSGICASSMSPKEAWVQAALYSAIKRCSVVGSCAMSGGGGGGGWWWGDGRGLKEDGRRLKWGKGASKWGKGASASYARQHPPRAHTWSSACSHSPNAPMRSPAAYLALPLVSSCSACARERQGCECVCVGVGRGGGTNAKEFDKAVTTHLCRRSAGQRAASTAAKEASAWRHCRQAGHGRRVAVAAAGHGSGRDSRWLTTQ